MRYSVQTINEALDADNQKGKLHRDMLTIEDMEESEFGEIGELTAESEYEKEKFMRMHEEDNMEDSNFNPGCHICGDPRGH